MNEMSRDIFRRKVDMGIEADKRFSDGWSSGNYDNAYEGDVSPLLDGDPDNDWKGGYLLGYFASYEADEVPFQWCEIVAQLRSAQADRCERLGIANDLDCPPKYTVVSCSQCGQEFGPGDHGYSHCSDHQSKRGGQ